MKKVIINCFLIVGLALTAASCSQKTSAPTANRAQTSKQNRPPMGQRRSQPKFADLLQDMDLNKDGKLAKNEVKGPLQNDFAKVDTDKDGFISESEFNSAPKRPHPGR